MNLQKVHRYCVFTYKDHGFITTIKGTFVQYLFISDTASSFSLSHKLTQLLGIVHQISERYSNAIIKALKPHSSEYIFIDIIFKNQWRECFLMKQ